MHSDLFDRIDRTVTEHNMLCPEDRVVAAVSGGADSMLLLHYLLSRRERWQLQIAVAHVGTAFGAKAPGQMLPLCGILRPAAFVLF